MGPECRLKLINQEIGVKVGWPLALDCGDKALNEQLQAARFVVHSDPEAVRMEYAAQGVYARKSVRFDSENYLFSLEGDVSKDGKRLQCAVVWQGHFGDQSIPQEAVRKNAVYQVDASVKRRPLQSLKDAETYTTFRAGVEDQYFAAMVFIRRKSLFGEGR
jgi:hypothetical protein